MGAITSYSFPKLTAFNASAVQAVRRASPFPPVPDSAQSLIGDLRTVLDPTRPMPEPFPGQKT
jgi:hypothetical protein